MSSLTVFRYDDAGVAERVAAKLQDLQTQELLQIRDFAIVSWPQGDKKPKTRTAVNTGAAGAVDGAFWGLLFGIIFFVPLLGAALGGALGALSGSMVDVGINDEFIKKTRASVTEGTSALFLLTDQAVIDRIAAEFSDFPHGELIASNLTTEQEASVRELFG